MKNRSPSASDRKKGLRRKTQASGSPRWLTVVSPRRIECDSTPSRPTDYDRDFDEIVIDHHGKCWLHVEMLGNGAIFVSVGSRRIWLHATRGGVRETMTEVDAAPRLSAQSSANAEGEKAVSPAGPDKEK